MIAPFTKTSIVFVVYVENDANFGYATMISNLLAHEKVRSGSFDEEVGPPVWKVALLSMNIAYPSF